MSDKSVTKDMNVPKRVKTEAMLKHPGGRPCKDINKKQFESLMKINPTGEEVSAVLDVTITTLNRWCQREYGASFSQVLKKSGKSYKTSVRRNLLRLSTRNGAVAIFLAKNELGMSDNPVPLPTGGEQQVFAKALREAGRLWSVPSPDDDGDGEGGVS